MRLSTLSVSLAAIAGVSALPQKLNGESKAPAAPALPPQTFKDTQKFRVPIPLEIAKQQYNTTPATPHATNKGFKALKAGALTAAAGDQCGNLRTRTEWDNMSDNDRTSFVNAIKCLMTKAPSGNFANSKSRYEDMVSLHQTMTNTIHGNDIFLFWHRYYVWTFEDMLRQECGFNTNLPYFDETKHTGNFPASSIFTSRYFGSLQSGGGCVQDSPFSNGVGSDGSQVVNLDIGPGSSDQPHCLSRDYDQNAAGNVNTDYVNLCNGQADYHSMGSCSEGGPHAYGHIAVGGVMNDIYGSPGDAVFHLHHAFVDRNFYNWQYADANNRLQESSINGNDASGAALTADTTISMQGLRPDVKVRDVLNPQGTLLCYQYA